MNAATSAAAILDGRYVLQDVIGTGGMATVFRANDTALDRQVAVKLLRAEISGEASFAEQFLAIERRIARLFHPNLVTIYDAGSADGQCFVVMEYVDGGSLRVLLDRGELLPIADAVRIIAQIAGALEVLHSERIIHGDVKPDNVLLAEDGSAKLVDFGIARLATITGSLSSDTLGGSVPYLAPEQLESGRADARSDIYALGLVSYELLVGRRAFDGENWVAVAAQRLARDPEPLRTLRPKLPAALNEVVMRALARDPDQRFATAGQFRAALPEAARETRSSEVEASHPPWVPEGSGTSDTAQFEAKTGLARVFPPVGSWKSRGPAGRRSNSPRRDLLGDLSLTRLLRCEDPLSVPVTVLVILVDLLLLIVILALRP